MGTRPIDTRLLEVGKELQAMVVPHVLDKKHSLNLFLVGSGKRPKGERPSLRTRLRKELEANALVQVYYPEDLFGELIWGEQQMNLLDLENLLADSVHAVVMCIESAGALVELGAFSNSDPLRDRLVVIMDEKYRKARSFVRLGPVRLLEQNESSAVVWHDYGASDLTALTTEVLAQAKRIRHDRPIVPTLLNPVYLERFLLVSISVLQPISEQFLTEWMSKILPHKARPEVIVSALAFLFHKKALSLDEGSYTVTSKGLKRLESLLTKENWSLVRETMDDLRAKAILVNCERPKKKEFVFGGRGSRS